MAANTSNGNVITMVDVNAKSSRSMSIDPSQFKNIARKIAEQVAKYEELEASDKKHVENKKCLFW